MSVKIEKDGDNMAEISLPVKNIKIEADDDLQSASDFKDLLRDFLSKQKETEGQCNKDTEKVNSDSEHETETLTLYATNEDESTEPQMIHIDTNNVTKIYSNYLNSTEVDLSSMNSYHELSGNPEVGSSFASDVAAPKTLVSTTSFSQASTVDVSISSSGYISASSPVISNDTSSPVVSSDTCDGAVIGSRTVTPDPLSIPSPAASDSASIATKSVPEPSPTSIGNTFLQGTKVLTVDASLSSPVGNVSNPELVASIPISPVLVKSDPPDFPSGNSTSYNHYYVPSWLPQVYPEIYQAWKSNSANEYYQGGLLHCSVCKKNPSSGFHNNLPLCDTHRIGRACTVCRLRLAAGFSYGLALCEADRIFLYKMFVKPIKIKSCATLCPITVQQWCPYCRLRTCLSTKGFRFTTDSSKANPVSKARKRKLSDIETPREVPAKLNQVEVDREAQVGNISTMNLHTNITETITLQEAGKLPMRTTVSNLSQPPRFVQPSFKLMPGLSKVASFQAENPPFRETTQAGSQQQGQYSAGQFLKMFESLPTFIPQNRVAYQAQEYFRPPHPVRWPSTTLPTSVPLSSNYGFYQTQPQNYPVYSQVGQGTPSMTSPYFNGNLLGTSNSDNSKREGVLTDPNKQSWVREQQEKYLRYHMKLYESRSRKK